MYLTSAVSAPTGVRRALPMTRACFLRLEAELNCLGPALREAEREHRQPASADVSSLAAVLAADRLRQLEHKLTSLRRVLAGVEIIEPDGVVVLGSHVAVGEVDGSQADYQIVIPGEADPVAGRISYESPMGQALLGHRAGADVTVTAPAGRRQVRIIAVE